MQAIEDLPQYYQDYLNELAEAQPFEKDGLQPALAITFERTMNLFADVFEEMSHYAYAEGKWSIIEVLGHLIDVERIFTYRALRIARGDQDHLSAFDENAYVTNSSYHERPFPLVKQELLAVQEATGYFFEGLQEKELHKMGWAANWQVSPHTIGFVLAAHRNHHINILRDRYLTDYQ